MSQKLSEVLDLFGVQHKTNARSFIIKDCPSCGRNNHTVWMFRPETEDSTRTGGQCWVCGTKFSTYTLIVQFGFEKKEVRQALGIGQFSIDLDPESWKLPDFNIEEKNKIEVEQYVQEKTVPEHYQTVWDWPSHEISKYARSRGVVGALGRSVWIDPLSHAVAFSIKYQGKHVGFQKRFVNPGTLKTKTDGDIPKARSFITVGTEKQPICVVEGPFDAVAAAWCGYFGVSTMGASISKTQAQEIAMMAFNQNPDDPTVYIALDRDEAGETGSRYVARLLEAYGITAKRVFPAGAYKDLNEALTNGSGLELSEQEEFLNIDGLDKIDEEWHWSKMVLEGFRYGVGIDYTWKDFRQDPTKRGQNRRKALNRLRQEDPEKYQEVLKKIEKRNEKRQKRMEFERLL